VGMISHLGPQNGVADGIALATKLKKENKIRLSSMGWRNQPGRFSRRRHVAAVWDLPVIFVIENNGYGLSTQATNSFRCKNFID